MKSWWSLAQFNPVVGNPEYNALRIIQKMEEAAKAGSKVIFFGELALTGYFAQDLFFNGNLTVDRVNAALDMIKFAADKLGIAVGLGLPRRNPNQDKGQKRLMNSFHYYDPAGNEFIQDKMLLPTYAEFDEYRWFEPANSDQVLVRDINGLKIGFIICEDGWNNKIGVPEDDYRLYEEDPIQILVDKAKAQGVKLDALVNISASPDYIGKQHIRQEMNQRIASHYGVPMVFLNLAAGQDQLVFGGQSFVQNAKGEVVMKMAPFREDMAQLDPRAIGRMKAAEVNELTEDNLMQELDYMIGRYLRDYFVKSGMMSPAWTTTINSELVRDAGLAQTIVENVEKSGRMPKAVLGLSGGKDSTAVAVILKRHLGPENVLGVMMPYREGNFSAYDSQRLGRELGTKMEIEVRLEVIDRQVESYREVLGFEDGDVTHQNIQARVRADILWGIANKEGRVVINTTNFSEAATGYGTIGGDLLGLPLIASLPASMVIRYLAWLQKNGESAVTDEMIHRPPSAELAPDQFDANELGDYDLIDPILETLRLNFGDFKRTMFQLTEEWRAPGVNKAKRKLFYAELVKQMKKLSRRLLINTEFKRWYYNKTPQFTPFSWLRWQWPIANGFMDVERYVDEAAQALLSCSE